MARLGWRHSFTGQERVLKTSHGKARPRRPCRHIAWAAALAAICITHPPARAQSPGAAPDAAGTPDTPTEQITVVATTPLLGSGIDRNKVPANVVVIRAGDLTRTGTASATRALNETAGSVDLDQAVGNDFQPNLLFRGFEASPLAGDAQGLAVYLNGSRFNSAFADATNWDLIPDIAIEELEVTGASPAFGLNALGGAVSVRLKNGFTAPGGEAEISGGSFAKIQVSGQYGLQSGNEAAYVAFTGANTDGWRDNSPSQLRQMFGDLGWKNNGSEIHLSVLGAINNLVGNGTTPVELLDADRASVFTYPDETRNHAVRAILDGNIQLNDTDSIQSNAYYSYLDQLTFNGDAGDEIVCANDARYVCEDTEILTNTAGQPIRNVFANRAYVTHGFPQYAAGGPYSVLNVTATRSNAYGGSAQFTTTREILGLGNHFSAGASYDGGASAFSAETYLGGFTLDRGYVAYPNTEIDQADNSISPVSVHTTNDYVGLFAVDTLDITPLLSATASVRYNHATVDLRDQLGTALNGNHGFNRINPGAGLTYRLAPNLTIYAGYAESNRAPTPSELSCADPTAPCSLTNFFVGDPDLKQVVSHSWEAGLNGHVPLAGGRLTGHAGYFRTENVDDIQFVTSITIGRAFFRNVGETLRQGTETSLKWQNERWLVNGSYTYTDATFQTPLTLNNGDNPAANADGTYFVHPGDRLPGIPAHAGKFGVQYRATEAWNVGLTGIAASGQYLFGDEGNQSPKASAYCLFNFDTTYQVTPHVQLFGSIENMFGARYETYGTFAPTDSVPIVQAPGASISRALTPGAPVAGFGGVRVTF